MRNRRRLAGFELINLLLLVTAAELAFNRLATRELRPLGDTEPPWWHQGLDHVGLFCQYFASTLAIAIIARQLWQGIKGDSGERGVARWGLIGSGVVFLGLAALNIINSPGEQGSFWFEGAFVAMVVFVVLGQLNRRGDLASKLGILLCAAPLVIPFYGPLSMWLVEGNQVLGDDLSERVYQLGQWSMLLAVLMSPYCFGPRPFFTASARLGPLVVAAFVGVIGLVILRQHYEVGMRLAFHGLGIALGPGAPAPFLALYLLALSTITWTVTACLSADVEARRDIGAGLALLAIGGYGFAWPLQYLVGIVGMMAIGTAARRVSEQERAQAQAAKPGLRVPPIAEDVWRSYANTLAAALASPNQAPEAERQAHPTTGQIDHAITEDAAITQVRCQRHGVHVTLRIERRQGAIFGMDVVCSKQAATKSPSDPDAEPQWTMYALPERLLGIGAHPGPPNTSAPVRKIDDLPFAQRFRVHDAGRYTERLLDEGLRARATALVDGWMAFWDQYGLHYRVQPGQGAPLDTPIPITELAFRGAAASASPERVVTLIDLIAEICGRGLNTDNAPPAA